MIIPENKRSKGTMGNNMKPIIYVSPAVFKTLKEDSSISTGDFISTLSEGFSIEVKDSLTGNQMAIPDPEKLKQLQQKQYDDMLFDLKRLGEYL